jgi:hypothetical protein
MFHIFQSKSFAEDLYGETASYTPALTAEQFIAGENSLPSMVPFLELQAASSTCKGFSATNSSVSSVTLLTQYLLLLLSFSVETIENLHLAEYTVC